MSTLIEWDNLDINIRNSESYTDFKKSIFRFKRLSQNFIFTYHNPSGIKLITGFRLGFSHIREHKFRHNFQDCRKYRVFTRNTQFVYHNKLSLPLEALSNCDNFTVITILYNNYVLTWNNKSNNKYQVTIS